ncbi:hypothetical protein [Streptomyces sp. NPDC006274]
MALVADFVLRRRGRREATSGRKAATAVVHAPAKPGRSHDT